MLLKCSELTKPCKILIVKIRSLFPYWELVLYIILAENGNQMRDKKVGICEKLILIIKSN